MKRTYGLFTVISMIVGIVVGSGIYFRADDIFMYANGNLGIAILVLALGSICIVFGGLSLSILSKDYVAEGGIVSYFETFVSKKFAAGYAWFQLFIWMPSISIVVSWAAALYTFMLFGIDANSLSIVLLGLLFNLIFIALNYFSKYFGGLVQRLATIIKLIPLIIIATYGLFFADTINISDVFNNEFVSELSNFSWLSALVPIAYSFDGWMIALNIAKEVETPKKNMTRALIISPLIVLLVYMLFIVGMGNILGPQEIINFGDSAIFEAAKLIMGKRFANVILVTIVISIFGVANGLSLGAIRLPQAFVKNGMIPSFGIKETTEDKISRNGSILFAALVSVWALIHYLVLEFNIFSGRDVSEIAIVFSYVSYILVYVNVLKKLKSDGKKSQYFIPIIAIIGSLMILLGSILASPLFITLFILICASICIVGSKYYSKKQYEVSG